MRPLLIGDYGGPIVDEPVHPLAPGGGRFVEAAELTDEEFLGRFDRINLVPNILNDPDESYVTYRTKYMERAADNLRPIMRGRRAILLGTNVARAFGVGDFIGGDWERWHECVAAVASAPTSERWADGRYRKCFSDLLRRSLLPCVHVEGPDGCGKSTLIPELRRLLSTGSDEMRIVPTEGPPKYFEECLMRIAARIDPGIISDRSSGLISELVYGPVLRGGVCGGDEEPYWQIVRSFAQAVTFVYCRPPLEALRPNFRPEEPENFARDVLSNMAAIANKYDDVMQRVQALGGRVILYDRTSMTAEDVARCVG